METLRHWGWIMSQTDLPPSATDRLVWFLTGACAFLFVVGVILFLMLRATAWRR